VKEACTELAGVTATLGFKYYMHVCLSQRTLQKSASIDKNKWAGTALDRLVDASPGSDHSFVDLA